MDNIAIYGAGGLGKEIVCLIRDLNLKKSTSWDIVGFFDDGFAQGEITPYGKILGGIQTINEWTSPLSIVFAIANPNVIKKLTSKIKNPYVNFPNIFASDILFLDRFSLNIGKGNVFMFGNRISCDVSIGDFNICNGSVSIGHNATIGSYNILGPLSRISGKCLVGNMNFFGLHSAIVQGKKVGDNTRIGAGSIVMRNTKDNHLYFGNPAKKIKM